MALVQVPTRVDDIDGTHGDVESVVIGYRGKLFTIDLGAGNRARLDDALQGFIAYAYEFGELPQAPDTQDGLEQTVRAQPRTPRPPAPRRTRVSRPAASTQAARSVKDGAKVAAIVPPATQEIRKWGRDNGFTVSSTGQIPRALRAAYDLAHAI